jgi:hypothetical protein
MKIKDMTTLHLRKSIGRSPLRHGFLVVAFALALALFAPSPTARAQLPPPAPDGGYPNGDTAEGTNALFNNSGSDNTAIGDHALFTNTTGVGNTAIGFNALFGNTSGGFNTANGDFALFRNTTGRGNTATGVNALFVNTSGGFNTANGFDALFNNTTGSDNTADGVSALGGNTTGSSNTANGGGALAHNTTGSNNTANGDGALEMNKSGSDNTANGVGALQNNNADNNTATGVNALFNNSTGKSNIALGVSAGANLTTGNSNIEIGNAGVAGEASRIRIGTVGIQTNTFIAGIHGVTVARALGVVIDVNGHLGTVTSSERFKDEIKPMDKASEAILALKPVTFRYKKELDPDGIPQFGLVAEQVEKVNPDLVVRDADGKINTVRYEAVNAMLLNEFLKEHRKVEEQKATIAQLRQDLQVRLAEQQKQIEALTAGLKEQAAQIEKVSAKLELSKGTPSMIANN